MTAASTPTKAWQAMVPELPPFESPADTADGPPVASPADTAERLLLLLHYTIDWDTSWVADPRYRKNVLG